MNHNTSSPLEGESLTPLQVAKILKLSKTKTYGLHQKREIPVIRIGKSVRVQLSDLEEYIKSRKESV